MPRRAGTLSIAVAAALVVTGCASATSAGPTGQASPTIAPTLQHVHGLGVDSAGVGYVATHAGVFRLPSLDGSSPTAPLDGPLGGNTFDLMGFAAEGDTFYGSGHAAESGGPHQLGFVRSDDLGVTWQPVSLEGEVDFHDLAVAVVAEGGGSAAEVRLVAFDSVSGRIFASADGGETWTTGAQLALRDLTIDTAIPDRVWATTADGVMVSEDEGVTFAPLAGAPMLYLIDSLGDGGLIGVDTTGDVWSGDDSAWTKTGALSGSVDAFSYSASEDVLLAVDERGVVVSDDRGASWRVIAEVAR